MGWYGGYDDYGGGWAPYVSVATRRANAVKHAARLAKKEKREPAPVKLDGKKIAHSFWGLAWCDNLERYSDFANRLPRGRTYVRNGSVVDLVIERGKVKAIVAGSEVYTVSISITTLDKAAWKQIKQDGSRSIDSMIDLLQGRFDKGIMERLTERDKGLFPKPAEIKMSCSCPDSATLCKHVAAVLYGVGARLDAVPELLFTLRAVDHIELISQAVTADNLDRALGADQAHALAGNDLGELFGIDIETGGNAQQNAEAALPPKVVKKARAPRKRAAAATVPVEVAAPVTAKASASLKPSKKRPSTEKPAAKKKAIKKSRARKPVVATAPRRKQPASN